MGARLRENAAAGWAEKKTGTGKASAKQKLSMHVFEKRLMLDVKITQHPKTCKGEFSVFPAALPEMTEGRETAGALRKKRSAKPADGDRRRENIKPDEFFAASAAELRRGSGMTNAMNTGDTSAAFRAVHTPKGVT